MAIHDVEKLKLRTYEHEGQLKLGVEFYAKLDPPDLKASQDLTEAEAIAVRDFLIDQFPVT